MAIRSRRTPLTAWVPLFAALLPSALGGCSSAGAPDEMPTSDVYAATSTIGNVTFRTDLQGRYVGAQNNGGGAVIATATVAQAWERFTILDRNGGSLDNGDEIFLKAGGGQYFQAVNGGGGAMNAASANELDWETFRIIKASGSGTIHPGDVIGLQTITSGNWVSAEDGGGGPIFAYGAALGPWERFVIDLGSATPIADAGAADSAPPNPGPKPDSGPTPTPSAARVVAYLPNYSGSFRDWAHKIDFHKMTHLNLAFATATGSNDWDMGASDSDVKALVDAAHASGVKVLASLGGGGGDQSVIARYRNPANIDDLVTKLDRFVTAHDFDGADVDIEDGGNLGTNYSIFVDKIVAKLRPRGKLVTAAVAQYLQDSMSDTTLHQFDFVNVMIYTNYQDSVDAMTYYTATKHVPKGQLTIGAGFFGTDSTFREYAYSEIMASDGSAWSKDQAQVQGKTVHYTGMSSMKKIAEYSKGFGGIMFWELSEDVPGEHSLYKVIQDTM